MLSTLRSVPLQAGVRHFATKEVRHGAAARAVMLEGATVLARAVAVTLGPKGRNVVIEQPVGAPKVTKDGVTVARAVSLPIKMMNVGSEMLKQVATKTNDVAGDGTTSSTVLAHHIFREGSKAVAAGMNPMDIKRGIDTATKVVLDDLRQRSTPISTTEEIASVATISANGDKEIGSLIASAFERVGEAGTITIGDGKTLVHELDVVEGMKFDKGYISPYFITDAKSQRCVFEDPLTFVYDKKVSSLQSIIAILEYAVNTRRPLVIIAEDVESEALSTLIMNKLRGSIQVAAVKAPGFGDHRKACIEDIAVLTGSTIVSEERGQKLDENLDVESILGTAKAVTITKDDTIILGGAGEKSSIDERCELIKSAIEANTSNYEKDKLKERLAKLAGGVAVIKVGGASEIEVGEVKDRLNDALNATRAAVEEGIVPGGGTALLYATKKLEALELANFEQKVGVEIIKTALRAPIQAIIENAGGEGAVVVEKLLSEGDESRGYDAQTGTYVNMISAGILDPHLVVATGLADAASVAGLMTTTQALVADMPEELLKGKNAHVGAGYGGGMDDDWD